MNAALTQRFRNLLAKHMVCGVDQMSGVLLKGVLVRMKYSSLALSSIVGGLLMFSACKPQPASINVSTDNLQLLEGGATGSVTAEVMDKEGKKMEGVAVTWKSSDPAVAEVDNAGAIKAVGSGTATVSASVEALSKDVAVTVSLPKSIDVGGKTSLTLTPEMASQTLTAQIMTEKGEKWMGTGDVTWASDKPEVAVVEFGVVTGVGTGAAKITGNFKDMNVEIAVDSTVTDKAMAMNAHSAALAAMGKTSALVPAAPAAPADGAAAAPAPAAEPAKQ